jgi:hypothetical protein
MAEHKRRAAPATILARLLMMVTMGFAALVASPAAAQSVLRDAETRRCSATSPRR